MTFLAGDSYFISSIYLLLPLSGLSQFFCLNLTFCLQAFLWNDEPEYRHLLALGLHLLSIGCLFSVQAMSKFQQMIASLLTRWDNYKQPISGNLANARILIGATLSIINLIFTALEMHTLVRKLFKSLIFY